MSTNQPYEEHALLLRIAGGDEPAFSQLHQQFYRPLVYFTFQITRDMPQAEDIASIALAKYWDKRKDFNSLPQLRTFLYTTAKNAALNYLKSLRVRSAAIPELQLRTEISEDQAAAWQVEAEILRDIHEAVTELPAVARSVFELLYFEGLSTDAVAQKLDMPVQTVRNNKTRALGLLRLAMVKRNISPAWVLFFL